MRGMIGRMSLQCNIDAKGKCVRLIYGLILAIAGVILLFLWALPAGGVLAWSVCTLLILGGALAIFEARKGWCIVRAMGIKTPM